MTANIVLTSFTGAGIEFLEAAAIAYALGKSGYPREAIIGSVCGLILVTLPAIFCLAIVPTHTSSPLSAGCWSDVVGPWFLLGDKIIAQKAASSTGRMD